MSKPVWGDLDRLQKWSLVVMHASAKLSANQIADKFVGATRNAIIGFCDRNKITLDGGKGGHPFASETPPADTAPPKKRAAPKKPLAPRPAKAKQTTPTVLNDAPSIDIASELFANSAPVRIKTTIMNIREGQCRWPLFSDALSVPPSELEFCGGLVAGKSYCSEHLKMAYTPVARRKRGDPPSPPTRHRVPFKRWLA